MSVLANNSSAITQEWRATFISPFKHQKMVNSATREAAYILAFTVPLDQATEEEGVSAERAVPGEFFFRPHVNRIIAIT